VRYLTVGLKQIPILDEYWLVFATQIVKLALEYSLISCDPAFVIMKATEFDWQFKSGTLMSIL